MIRAFIIAFDGGLARNSALRVHALLDAAAAEAHPLDAAAVAAVLPGRTFLEAALTLCHELAATDPTVPELMALRAQRGYRALVQHGVSFHAELMAQVHTASAAGHRVIVRADSERRDVEPLIMLAGVEHMITLLRCSDDAPRGAGASLRRSWEAVHARLDNMGVGVTERTAFETSRETADTAAPFVQSTLVW